MNYFSNIDGFLNAYLNRRISFTFGTAFEGEAKVTHSHILFESGLTLQSDEESLNQFILGTC